jgi:hypothetical protein
VGAALSAVRVASAQANWTVADKLCELVDIPATRHPVVEAAEYRGKARGEVARRSRRRWRPRLLATRLPQSVMRTITKSDRRPATSSWEKAPIAESVRSRIDPVARDIAPGRSGSARTGAGADLVWRGLLRGRAPHHGRFPDGFMGAPGSGRPVVFRMLHVFEFRGGAISGEDVWLDAGAIVAQLPASAG